MVGFVDVRGLGVGLSCSSCVNRLWICSCSSCVSVRPRLVCWHRSSSSDLSLDRLDWVRKDGSGIDGSVSEVVTEGVEKDVVMEEA